MVRPTNQEMTTIEKIFFILFPKRKRHATPQEAEGEGEMWSEAFIVVFTGRNGKVWGAGLELASLNHFKRL